MTPVPHSSLFAMSVVWRTVTALTVRGLLLRAQGGNTLTRIVQRALHVTGRGASWNIVQREHLSKPKVGVEGRIKAGMNRLQISEGKFL